MQNHKLITTLKSLSPKELKEFKTYVHSPFFNQHQSSQKLLIALLTYAPNFDSEEISEKALFGVISSSQPINKQRLREAFAKLFKLLKGYLAYREFQAHPAQQELYTLSQFRKRGLNKAFQTQFLSLQRQLTEAPLFRVEAHYIHAELSQEANGFYGQKQLRVFDNNLQDRANHLDIYYLVCKLRASCEMLNRKHVMNADYDLHVMPELESWIENQLPEALQVPSVLIYVQIYLSLKKGDQESHYEKLVALLDQYHQQFSHEEVRAMYKYAQNYCIRQINQGNLVYHHKLFDLYQSQLDNGRIFIEGELSHTDYKNITTVGLRSNQFDWVKTFLEAYQKRVHPSFRMNVYHYCLASFYLEQNQYGQTIRLLQQVTFTDLQYRISAQYLLLKAYYEIEDWDLLDYIIKAFSNFLRRNKGISPLNRINHKNFLIILKELLKLQDKKFILDKEELTKGIEGIEQRMDDMPQIPHNQWLTEKLAQLPAHSSN